MRSRWYDPELGRFISEDPMGVAGGINQYIFVHNDPVNGFDPYGLCSLKKKGSDQVLDAIEGVTATVASGEQYVCENGRWKAIPTLAGVTTRGDPVSHLGFGFLDQLDMANVVYYSNQYGQQLEPVTGRKVAVRLPNNSGRMFSTNYCGPGGGGSIVNGTDLACYRHDRCYERAGLSANYNTSWWKTSSTSSQAQNAYECNQQLCNEVRKMNTSNSSTSFVYRKINDAIDMYFSSVFVRWGTQCR